MQLAHTMLRVRDLEKSLDFYINFLGLHEVRRSTIGNEATLVFLADDNQTYYLELTHNHDGRDYELGNQFGHIALTTHDLDAVRQTVIDKGWWYRESKPTSNSRYIFVHDPDGYDIEILQDKGGETVSVEHANITVKNIERSVKFFQTAFPDWQVRDQGESDRKWLHFGGATDYVAIEEARVNAPLDRGEYMRPDINHIGFAVSDLAAVKERLLAAAYTEGMAVEPDGGLLRAYFFDEDGFEWEFIEYLLK
ncbi:MAG: lactoylglutathione lyase [Myxococcota bacterium]|jgi:lactoylglutathione lyase